MAFNPATLTTHETRATIAHQGQDWFGPEDACSVFATVATCNNTNCREPVVICGTTDYDADYFNNEDGYPDRRYIEFFSPSYVNPSPNLIPLPRSYPEEVKTTLKKAFVSFWDDYAAAGNHIRSTVERLLDHLKVPNKPGLKLHHRIENFAKTNADLAHKLEAVKWLGNAGSHSDELKREDVFDAFDILDHVLNKLFNIDHVSETAQRIVDKKGPIRD